MFSDASSENDAENNTAEQKLSFPGFSTAGKNITVAVSKDALDAVRQKFGAEEESNSLPTSPSLPLSSTKPLKRKLEPDDDSRFFTAAGEENGNPPVKSAASHDIPNLFHTAGTNSPIIVRDSSMQRARQTMDVNENGQSPCPASPLPQLGPPPASSFTSPLIASAPSPVSSKGGNKLRLLHRNTPFRSPVTRGSPEPSRIQQQQQQQLVILDTPSHPASHSELKIGQEDRREATLAPFESVTPLLKEFCVRGRVFECAREITASGSDQYFSFRIADENGAELECEARGSSAVRAASLIKYDKTFDFAGGRVLKRRPSKDNETGIVILIDDRCTVTESPTVVAKSSKRRISTLTPLVDVVAGKSENDEEIDVAGVVCRIHELTEESNRIEIELAEIRSTLSVLLPASMSVSSLAPGLVLLANRCKRLKAKDGSGTITLQCIPGRTRLLLSPQSDDARLMALSRWAAAGNWRKHLRKAAT